VIASNSIIVWQYSACYYMYAYYNERRIIESNAIEVCLLVSKVEHLIETFTEVDGYKYYKLKCQVSIQSILWRVGLH